ncbi:hypothetical protein Tco_0241126 [Tanacetum coccineum]
MQRFNQYSSSLMLLKETERFLEESNTQGKFEANPNGKLIWKSIHNAPTPHLISRDPPPTDSTIGPAPKENFDSEFSEEKNKLEMQILQLKSFLSKCSSKKVICYNLQGERTFARQCKEPQEERWTLSTSKKALLMEAKKKGDV